MNQAQQIAADAIMNKSGAVGSGSIGLAAIWPLLTENVPVVFQVIMAVGGAYLLVLNILIARKKLRERK